MKISKKIEYFLFIVLLFLQNFALIKTDEFGINGMTCFLFLLSVLNAKRYYSKVKKKTFLILMASISFLFISAFFNDTFYISQIFRYIMVLWLIYMANIYINSIYEKNEQEYFYNLYTKILLIFMLYGIYELIANIYSLPLVLNVFGNNPSYEPKTLYRYYGGWADKTRLYNAFFEPSVFSVFLVYNIFFVKEMKNIPRLRKKMLYYLMIFNLIFTYARTGYVTMIYMIGIYILYDKILKNKQKTSFIDAIMLLLPFFNLFIMYFIGLNLFNDLSSLARTYSGIFYLQNSFSTIKNILFGHSIGSITNGEITMKYIEKQAHNGYVDIMYQLGIIAFISLLIFLYNRIRSVKNKRYLIVGVLATFCCFASYFCVETIIVQIVLIYNFCKNEK